MKLRPTWQALLSDFLSSLLGRKPGFSRAHALSAMTVLKFTIFFFCESEVRCLPVSLSRTKLIDGGFLSKYSVEKSRESGFSLNDVREALGSPMGRLLDQGINLKEEKEARHILALVSN